MGSNTVGARKNIRRSSHFGPKQHVYYYLTATVHRRYPAMKPRVDVLRNSQRIVSRMPRK